MTKPPTRLTARRLTEADAQAYQALRLEGFAREPRAFRYAPEDESAQPLAVTQARLTRDFVVGLFAANELVGIAGLARCEGAKLAHKALIYGMYLRAAHRRKGGAGLMMRLLLDEARKSVETVLLTVEAHNDPARLFYERCGFESYGVEKRAAKLADGVYLDEMMMALSFDATR